MCIALLDIKRATKIGSKFSAVNMRNMQILAKELNADFIYSEFDKRLKNKGYNFIIYGFASVNAEIEKQFNFVNNNKEAKLFRLVGEYEQTGHSPLYYALTRLNKKHHVIINVDKIFNSYKKYISGQTVLNLNLLISKPSNELTQKKYDCIYYSRWRPNRAKYLKEYLKEDIYFSSDAKNFKQHKHIGCNPKWIKKLSWEEKRETLNQFRYSLYLEDEYTHKVYNHLANRWYESGFCNNVVFFDINCKNTIDHERTEIREHFDKFYYVSSYSELQEKIKECNKNFEKHLAIQKTWRLSEPFLREEMLKEFKSIILS